MELIIRLDLTEILELQNILFAVSNYIEIKDYDQYIVESKLPDKFS